MSAIGHLKRGPLFFSQCSLVVAGSTLISAPEPTKWSWPEVHPLRKRRRLSSPDPVIAITGQVKHFPDIEHGGLHFVAFLPNLVWYQQRVDDDTEALGDFIIFMEMSLN